MTLEHSELQTRVVGDGENRFENKFENKLEDELGNNFQTTLVKAEKSKIRIGKTQISGNQISRTQISKTKNSRDWIGKKFVFVSLIVTTASIIFFFAERQIFNKIEEARAAGSLKQWESLLQRVNEWGGAHLKQIDVQVVPEEPSLEILALPLRARLERLVGRSFWGLDIEAVKQEILSEGWPKNISIRRSFPSTLSIQILARDPRFLVKARSGWAVVDAGGVLVARLQDVSGNWAHLPIVFGFENSFSRDLSILELNRQLKKEQETLADLHRLVQVLVEKVGVEPESIHIREEAWANEPSFVVHLKVGNETSMKYVDVHFLSKRWSDRMESFQFVLSDLNRHAYDSVQILGQYDGRWFVRKGEN